MPQLDDAVELQAGGEPARWCSREARRMDLNQLNADWHNAYSSFVIDLSSRLQNATSDADRLKLMAGLKDKLGVPPVIPPQTPLTPVKASGTVLHEEASED